MSKASEWSVRCSKPESVPPTCLTDESQPIEMATVNNRGDLIVYGHVWPPEIALRLARWILDTYEDAP